MQSLKIVNVISQPSVYGKTKGSKQAGLWVLIHEPFFEYFDLTNDYKADNDAIERLKSTMHTTPTSTGLASTDNDNVNGTDNGNGNESANDPEKVNEIGNEPVNVSEKVRPTFRRPQGRPKD